MYSDLTPSVRLFNFVSAFDFAAASSALPFCAASITALASFSNSVTILLTSSAVAAASSFDSAIVSIAEMDSFTEASVWLLTRLRIFFLAASFDSSRPLLASASFANTSISLFAFARALSTSSFVVASSISFNAFARIVSFFWLISVVDVEIASTALLISVLAAFLASSNSLSGIPFVIFKYALYASAFVFPSTICPARPSRYLIKSSSSLVIALQMSDTLYSASSISFGVPSPITCSIVSVVSLSAAIPFMSLFSSSIALMSPPRPFLTCANARPAVLDTESISFAFTLAESLAINALYTLSVIDVSSLMLLLSLLIFSLTLSFNSESTEESWSPIFLSSAFPASNALDASSTVVDSLISASVFFITSSAISFKESESNTNES